MFIYLATVQASACVDGDYSIVVVASCFQEAQSLISDDGDKGSLLRRLTCIGTYTGHRTDAHEVCSDAVYR